MGEIAPAIAIGIMIGVATAVAVLWARGRWRGREVRNGEVEASAGDTPEFLADVLDALAIGVVVASPQGEIVYRNASATGVTRAVHTEVLVAEAVDNYVRAAVGGQGGCKVLDLFGPPRQVVSVTASALARGGAAAMIEDITERVLADAVRTDFVANISHELKTPIGAMSVLADALSQEEDRAVVQRLSSKISEEAMRVGRLIDDLLELSRIEYAGSSSSEDFEVGGLVDEAVDRTQTFAESRSIAIESAANGREIRISGDRRQLVSALQNLLENAIKYSEPGSAVDVSIRHADGKVCVDVRDQGVGIPVKELDRIFERFYRVDRARSRDTGGTGLGLSIARHIASNHGGEILVHSVEGVGSTFTLRLPESTPPGDVS